MEQNETSKNPAEKEQGSGGCSCGCGGGKNANRTAVVIWVILLAGLAILAVYSRMNSRLSEDEKLLRQAYEKFEKQDFEASTTLLRQSAERGNVWAQLYYGERLKSGFHAEQNIAEAVKWLRKAAQKKNFEACYQLGVCYENGEGVERNLDEAEVWYRKALEDPAFASSAQESLDRIANRKAENAAGSN